MFSAPPDNPGFTRKTGYPERFPKCKRNAALRNVFPSFKQT